MNKQTLVGLVLKVTILNENDKLLVMMNDTEGIIRLLVPSSCKSYSEMVLISPLCILQVQTVDRQGLKLVTQLKLLRNFLSISIKLEALSAAQGMIELCMQLVNDPIIGMHEELILQLTRLEEVVNKQQRIVEVLAIAVQGSVHQLALGGYGLPLQVCARSGKELIPSLKNRSWNCSFIPQEGFVIGILDEASIVLNSSEVALFQRIHKPILPRCSNGELMGPAEVWIRLLDVILIWVDLYLPKPVHAFSILRSCVQTSSLISLLL
uniref:Recombination protein O (RecO) n=1 Tax=Paulinella chromatophora TaxID=39717 RepID=B1X5B3_PAUCH|nr:Recombination protein O (RecO) [Paulinella chromatophora]ACB43132.1 Recombination protein O (RecO) [Paulinella chromatophora]